MPTATLDLLVVGFFDYAELMLRVQALQERTGREINVVAMRPWELREQLEQGSGFVRDIVASPMTVLVGDIGAP